VEVELVEGAPKLLAALGKRLVRAGARVSMSESKLARALAVPGTGDSAGSTPTRPVPRPKPKPVPNPAARRTRPGRAGDVVLDHLRDLVGTLLAQDPRARADAPDGVHQMRVATRKLRSFLATFRPLFDRRVTDPLRQELAWLGAQLGAARDAEVIRDHLLEDLARQPAEVVLGPVRDRVVTTMGERHQAAHAGLLVELASPRYFALLDTLDALVATPPLTERARQRAHVVLLPLVSRTWRRTRQLVRAVDRATDAGHRDVLLHDVRKAAKRARYASDSLAVAYGQPARVFASRMKAVQEVLGDHQDSVVIRQEILQLATDAERAGEATFTYGRLHAREEQRGALSEAEFARRWKRAAHPAVRAWLR
jgi:CHAD domain-containing protein